MIRLVNHDDSADIDVHEFTRFFISETEPSWVATAGHKTVISYWYDYVDTKGRGASIKGREETVIDAGLTLLAGGVAGGASRTVVAPLERLKILFQSQVQPGKYKGVIQSLKLIGKEEGLRGFFRGNGANCLRVVPQSAIQFYSFHTLKPYFANSDGEMTALRRLGAGALAGAFSLLGIYPLEMVRVRLTVDSSNRYNGIGDAFKKIVRHEGPRALYKGLVPSMAGIVPYVGLDFAVYETLRELPIVPKNAETNQPTVVAKLICGGIAGIIGQTVAYPLDTCRRLLQTQGADPNAPIKYKGMWHCLQTIYAEQGWRGFYRGLAPNYLKAAPAIAISFVIFEAAKDKLFAMRDKAFYAKQSEENAD
jgi:solute carrier family 25 (mitochondrial phosphate transporter), member 23/24/25/41